MMNTTSQFLIELENLMRQYGAKLDMHIDGLYVSTRAGYDLFISAHKHDGDVTAEEVKEAIECGCEV